MRHELMSPMFTITFQRDTIDVGGNAGMLSIGEMPSGVSEDKLTWVPLRNYTSNEGGLPAPPDSPNEVNGLYLIPKLTERDFLLFLLACFRSIPLHGK